LKKLKDISDITVAALSYGAACEEIESLGINLITVEKSLLMKYKLKQIIKSNNFDIIHSHGALCNIISYFKNVVNVSTVHSDYYRDYENSKLKELVLGRTNRKILKKFDAVIASDAISELLKKDNFKNVFLLNNGIEINTEFNKDRAEYLFEKKLDPIKTYIGICQRLEKIKNIDLIIKAMEKIDAELLVAGDGSQMDNLKKTAGKNVHFIGWEKDTKSFFNAIDINVLTSDFEGGIAYGILEGGIFKKPAISTNAGCMYKLIINNETGYLIERNVVNALVEKANILIKDTGLRNKLGQALYEKIKNEYSIESMAQTQLKIYKKILENAQ